MALTAEDIDRMTDKKGTPPADDEPADRGDEFVSTEEEPTGEEPTGEEPAGKKPTGEEPTDEEPARDPNTGKFIPKARFDEMSARSRQALDRAQARITELEGQVASNQEFKLDEVDAELDKLEKQYTDLLVDGKTDEASQLRGQIRSIERRYAAAQAAAFTAGTREQLVDSVKLDDVISQLEETFPFLDPQNEDYNDEVAQEVLDLFNGLVKNGWQQSVAMQRAASYVLSQLDIEWEGEEPEQPADDAQPQARTDQERRAAVKRGLEAIQRQPPVSTGHAGEPGSPRAVSAAAVGKMSQADFDKLDAAQIKKLRGDDFDGGE